MKKLIIGLYCLLLSACGDFPDYRFEQSDQYCVVNFPFATGIMARKYIGYFNVVSTLQYLDAEPEVEIFIGEPSNIELKIGSVQNVTLGDETFEPEYHKSYMQGELQYWGPAFTFNKDQSARMYQLMQEGYGPTIFGRVEVGSLYEADMYNFFFESNLEPFNNCINRLLSEDDLKLVEANRKNGTMKKKSAELPADNFIEIEPIDLSDSLDLQGISEDTNEDINTEESDASQNNPSQNDSPQTEAEQ